MTKNQAPFGDLPAAPDSVPVSTQGIQRPSLDAEAGKSASARARGTPKVNSAQPAGGNPYRSAWDGHDSTLGF